MILPLAPTVRLCYNHEDFSRLKQVAVHTMTGNESSPVRETGGKIRCIL